MKSRYRRTDLDDVHRRWIKEFTESGRAVPPSAVELAAISDEFSIDLTTLLRDYDTARATLRVRYRERDIAQSIRDMSEVESKRRLIELVGVARMQCDLCEALLRIAIERAGKARKATALKGAKARQAKDPKSVAHAAAKEAAHRIWPEAYRKGWTAERLWMALRDSGHKVPADTVRKWATKLRKSGTC